MIDSGDKEGLAIVVDDDPQSCTAVSEFVRSFGHEVQAFDSATKFLARLDSFDESRPTCVVADFRMPGADGLELLQRIADVQPTMSVVVLTAYAHTALSVRFLRNGAVAVLDKPFRDDELWSFIQEGTARSAAEIRRTRHHEALESRFKRLSPQDRQVLHLLMDGCKNRTMATRLEVSLRTVENRRRRVFEVMGAESVAQLARMVVEYECNLAPTGSPLASSRWLGLPYEQVA